MVTPFPSKVNADKIRYVPVPEGDITSMDLNHFEEPRIPKLETLYRYSDGCPATLANDQVQSLLKEKFDVILLSAVVNDCYLTFVHHLNVSALFIFTFCSFISDVCSSLFLLLHMTNSFHSVIGCK